jgi:hypothetical protein
MDQAMIRKQRRQRLIALGFFGAAAVVVLGILVRDARAPRVEAPPDWTVEDLMLADRPGFDHRRAAAFKRAIEKLGGRCDSVEKALMQRPGVWVARCAPGYNFRLTYVAIPSSVEVARLP